MTVHKYAIDSVVPLWVDSLMVGMQVLLTSLQLLVNDNRKHQIQLVLHQAVPSLQALSESWLHCSLCWCYLNGSGRKSLLCQSPSKIAMH